jgi:hypothetical protein
VASQLFSWLTAQLLKESRLPIGEFAPGAVYLQRQSGANIVPMGEGRR